MPALQPSQSPPHATTVRRRLEHEFSATNSRGMSEPGWNNTPLPSRPLTPFTSRMLSSALRLLFAHISKHPGVKGAVALRSFVVFWWVILPFHHTALIGPDALHWLVNLPLCPQPPPSVLPPQPVPECRWSGSLGGGVVVLDLSQYPSSGLSFRIS